MSKVEKHDECHLISGSRTSVTGLHGQGQGCSGHPGSKGIVSSSRGLNAARDVAR